MTIGHQYSSVALLPEAQAGLSPSWVVPLMTARVASSDDKEAVGAAQVVFRLDGDWACVYPRDRVKKWSSRGDSKPKHPEIGAIVRLESCLR